MLDRQLAQIKMQKDEKARENPSVKQLLPADESFIWTIVSHTHDGKKVGEVGTCFSQLLNVLPLSDKPAMISLQCCRAMVWIGGKKQSLNAPILKPQKNWRSRFKTVKPANWKRRRFLITFVWQCAWCIPLEVAFTVRAPKASVSSGIII